MKWKKIYIIFGHKSKLKKIKKIWKQINEKMMVFYIRCEIYLKKIIRLEYNIRI